MNKATLLFIFSLTFLHPSLSQDTVTYRIYFPNAVHHEAEISIRLEGVQANELTAIMSKSSPGRYAIHDFGKNIYNLKAYDDDNANVTIRKSEPDIWKLSGINNILNVSYTLYANHADGTYSGIDAEFANLNMPATFLWIKGMDHIPIKVIFNLPDKSSWKIATQLTLLDSVKNIYAAPNLQYFMDSPCILSDFSMKEFDVGTSNQQHIRMAINSDVGNEGLESFVNMTKKVVHEQKAIFGKFPSFRDSTYTFLCSYGPGFYGDGMEHRNSTMVTSRVSLAGNQNRLIGTVSHEFFHVWNMERIRPASLEPFDFTKANVCGELWFGEGFTSYYGDLALCRSGILSKDQYINSLGNKINYLLNTPGWKYGSPIHMSEMAPYTDNAAKNDEVNFSNTFITYYVYGEIIALALDLSLRTEFENVSLDDFMKAMWLKYGQQEIPYTNSDLQTMLSKVCDDSDFASEFFEDYIFGNELPDFESLFDKSGYRLIKKNPGKTSLGFVRLKFEGDTATLISQPMVESALYEAGLNKGDLILSIDEQAVTSYPELNFIIGTRKIGDEIDISFSHFGKLKQGSFKLKEDNQHKIIPKEKFSIKIKEEEEKLREDWLNSKVVLE